MLSTQYSRGDLEKSYELLLILEDSEEGIINPWKADVKLLGAVNREGVTCYLDALLFAMFARLGSFEAMLYKNFEDEQRKRLATLLRLWVNVLRAGKLITVDIVCHSISLSQLASAYTWTQTKQIQLQLANCGWSEAKEVRQQDASEAFTFITETLALPLLTLKMDIFHTGKEDQNDDHKFINERLLELAIPEEPIDGHSITLEECLELFFNNKIEVKRYLDSLERRNTMTSIRSRGSVSSTKGFATHVEVAELNDSQPSSPVRPVMLRHRAPSLIQDHYINEKHSLLKGEDDGTGQPRTRKEVMMPAWQFFSLIRTSSPPKLPFLLSDLTDSPSTAWYTNNQPKTDAQVAAHFSTTRPVLGICLKRYGVNNSGIAFKRRTHIDIPLEIGLPHFVSDDAISDDGPAFGNFKLSLQSVVCHEGLTVESGHYISLVRSPDPSGQGQDQWMRFDDIARERATFVSIEDRLRRDSPYLLFYQVIPIEGEPSTVNSENVTINGEAPPSYADSNTSNRSKPDSGIGGDVFGRRRTSDENALPRTSLDSTSIGERRGRSSMTGERPRSVALNDRSNGSVAPPAPTVEAPPIQHFADAVAAATRSELGVLNDGPNTLTASRRGSKATKSSSRSRPGSSSGEGRLSGSLTRLANRISRDKLSSVPAQAERRSEEVQGNNNPVSLEVDKANERARLKKEAKEKHKGAKHHHHLIKGEKPDRECSIM